jgi:hypothetical protein
MLIIVFIGVLISCEVEAIIMSDILATVLEYSAFNSSVISFRIIILADYEL